MKDIDMVTVSQSSSPEGVQANATTITNGGSQWTAAIRRKESEDVRDDTKTYVVDGQVVIPVEASSAVIVWL